MTIRVISDGDVRACGDCNEEFQFGGVEVQFDAVDTRVVLCTHCATRLRELLRENALSLAASPELPLLFGVRELGLLLLDAEAGRVSARDMRRLLAERAALIARLHSEETG